MAESTFGRGALNDWKLVGQLRSGKRRLWPETEAKVRGFMAAYCADQLALSGGNGADLADQETSDSCGLSLPHERRAGVPTLTTGAATFFDDLARVEAQ